MGDDWPTDEELDLLERTTVLYDLHETNPDNGLVRDKTDPAAPSNIDAVGLALAGLPVIAERGVLFRPYGFQYSFNRTFRVDGSPARWGMTPYQLGADDRELPHRPALGPQAPLPA